MSDMVERVALTICVTRRRWGWFFGDDRAKTAKPTAVDLDAARAAFEAIREPTEAMLTAGEAADISPHNVITDDDAEAIWRAMIDAALAPSPDTPGEGKNTGGGNG